MADVTIKTLSDVGKSLPLTDGTYDYKVYGRNGLRSATSLVVSGSGATYTLGTTTTTAYSLADFTAEVNKQIQADNSVTIATPLGDLVVPPAKEESSTPWLLYAAGAAVLYFLWKKSKK